MQVAFSSTTKMILHSFGKYVTQQHSKRKDAVRLEKNSQQKNVEPRFLIIARFF
jgi:hypothetical protein